MLNKSSKVANVFVSKGEEIFIAVCSKNSEGVVDINGWAKYPDQFATPVSIVKALEAKGYDVHVYEAIPRATREAWRLT